MTEDEEVRLECLKLASCTGAADPVSEAARMEAYVRGLSQGAGEKLP